MNRKEVTEWFLNMLNKLQKDNPNIKMYREYFDKLSDVEFSNLMDDLANEKTTLPYYVPNLSGKDISKDNLLKVGDELGLDFFQQLVLTDPVTGVTYVTPEKYLILHLPIRRQMQHVSKGKAVIENSSYIDSLTGQAAGASKSSQLSLPELLALESLGLHRSIEEMINVRGGNVAGFREAKRKMVTTGGYTLAEIEALHSRPTSVLTLKSFLHGMHLDSNI